MLRANNIRDVSYAPLSAVFCLTYSFVSNVFSLEFGPWCYLCSNFLALDVVSSNVTVSCNPGGYRDVLPDA